MRLLFIASGSGGHIYPAYALLKEAKKKHQVGYLIVNGSLEERIITDNDIDRVPFSIYTQAKAYFKRPQNLILLKKKIASLAHKMQDYDAVIAFGGFMSFVASRAAKKAHIRFFLHEQNAVLGDANAWSLYQATNLFTAFENIEIPTRYQKKMIFSGNPRADEAYRLRRTRYDITPFRILFLAGSLGSTTLLETIRLVTLDERLKGVEFTVITGQKHYEKAKQESWGMNVRLLAYSNEILAYMSRASLVVMRAGATSIFEIQALAIPALLIPSPYVKHDHQSQNAARILQNNEAFVMKEKDISKERLSDFLDDLLKNPQVLFQMRKRLVNKTYRSSTRTILDVIEGYDY